MAKEDYKRWDAAYLVEYTRCGSIVSNICTYIEMKNLLEYVHHVRKKLSPLMFDNNFGSDVHITKISTLPAMCYYTTLWKSKIQKC